MAPPVDRNCRVSMGDFIVFLAQAYDFKEISDYGVGDAAVVSDDEARTATNRPIC